MMIPIILMLAQPTAAPVVQEPPEQPVIIVCPVETTTIPPFGDSCDAKEQAKRVSEIMRDKTHSKTLEITRYRIIGDGRTIAKEDGEIVGTASPCLLPQQEEPEEFLAGKTEPPANTKPSRKRDASSQVNERCKTEKFAMRFVSPVAAGR